jgi:AraC family transcriptional regulator
MLPCEKPELDLQHHFLVLWDIRVAEGESAHSRGRFSSYRKLPNTISTRVPGVRPAVRSRFEHEVIVGAFHSHFIVGIEEELDRRPAGSLRQLEGTDAPDLRSLLRLLLKESETGGPCGTLYAESLMTALATLAAESGYSRAHFLRTFRAATGQTPHRYLLELRLQRARALVASRSMPLIAIAELCGFSSHAHLSNAFRSRFGVSPSAYQRAL